METEFTQDLLICDCSSAEHQLVVQYFENDNSSDVFVHMHLSKKSFFDRIVYGIKYVLGYQSPYGAFDEIILGPQHIDSLQNVINHIKKIEAKKIQLDMYDGPTSDK